MCDELKQQLKDNVYRCLYQVLQAIDGCVEIEIEDLFLSSCRAIFPEMIGD